MLSMRRTLVEMAAVASLLCLASAGTAAPLALNPALSTDFDGDSLPSHLSFTVPPGAPPAQACMFADGWLTMATTGRTDLYGGHDTAPKLLQPVPEGDFMIETRVRCAPDIPYEHAGILVYQDPTHYLRLIRDSNAGPPTYSGYGATVNLQGWSGQFSGQLWFECTTSDVVLRLIREGGVYTGMFSVEGGETFTTVGQSTHDWSDVSMGLTVVSTRSGNVFEAQFDYLHVYTPVLPVRIDIKPGDDANSINLGSNGKVPVAILSEPDFDATTVDPNTVGLAGAGVAIRGKGAMATQEDVNADGLVDLLLHVETQNLDPNALQAGRACLRGETDNGQKIEGCDQITIVPPR